MKKSKATNKIIAAAIMAAFILPVTSHAEEVGATMRARMNRLKSDNKELIKINKQLQRQVRKLEKGLPTQDTIAATGKAKEDVQAQPQISLEEYAQLKQDLEQKQKELDEANKNIGFYSERVRTLQEAYNKVNGSTAGLNQAHDEELATLSQQKIALGQSLELANEKIREQESLLKQFEEVDVDQEIKALKAERSKLQSELLSAMKQVKEVESSVPSLIEAVRVPLEERVVNQKEEIDALRAKSKEAVARMEKADRDKQEIEKQFKVVERKDQTREGHLTKITDELLKERLKTQGMKDELSNLRKAKEDNARTIATLTEENKKANEQITLSKKSDAEIAEMEQRKDFLEQQLAILNERNKNFSAIQDELKQAQKPFADEIARLEESLEALKKESAQKDVIIKTLRNQGTTLVSDSKAISLEDLISIKEELNKVITNLPAQ